MITDDEDKMAHALVHGWMEKITHDVDRVKSPESILALAMLVTSVAAIMRIKYPENGERMRHLFEQAVEQGFALGEDIKNGDIR